MWLYFDLLQALVSSGCSTERTLILHPQYQTARDKHISNLPGYLLAEFRSCVKVEVAILMSLMVSVDVKQH